MIAGVPKPWVISEKFVKSFWTMGSKSLGCWLLKAIVVQVLPLVAFVAPEAEWLLVVVVFEFPLAKAAVAAAPGSPEFRPQTGDLSRLRMSINSSSIWLFE